MRVMTIDFTRHVLQSTELDDPEPAAGEVLVRIRAAGLAYADPSVRAGTLWLAPWMLRPSSRAPSLQAKSSGSGPRWTLGGRATA